MSRPIVHVDHCVRRVAEEVQDDLDQLVSVAEHWGQRRIVILEKFHAPAKAVLGDRTLESLEELAPQIAKLDAVLRALRASYARLHSGEVEAPRTSGRFPLARFPLAL